MEFCWSTIKDILITAPGVVLTYLTIYFAYLKIGNKVSCSFSVSHSNISAEQIDNILLKNHKSKTISIFCISAVLDNEVKLEVEKFKTPILLKPLESITINTTETSYYNIKQDRFEPDFFPDKKIDIYLTTDLGIIKCINSSHPDFDEYSEFKHLTRVDKCNKTFNGVIYNENVKYGIAYSFNGETSTKFILNNGFIVSSEFNFTHVPESNLTTEETVTEFFKSQGLEGVLVHELK